MCDCVKSYKSNKEEKNLQCSHFCSVDMPFVNQNSPNQYIQSDNTNNLEMVNNKLVNHFFNYI